MKRPAIKHGTITRYYTMACRCTKCKTAARNYMRKLRSEMKARKDVPHGTTNGYMNYGCRCEKCKAAESERKKTRRQAMAAAAK